MFFLMSFRFLKHSCSPSCLSDLSSTPVFLPHVFQISEALLFFSLMSFRSLKHSSSPSCLSDLWRTNVLHYGIQIFEALVFSVISFRSLTHSCSSSSCLSDIWSTPVLSNVFQISETLLFSSCLSDIWSTPVLCHICVTLIRIWNTNVIYAYNCMHTLHICYVLVYVTCAHSHSCYRRILALWIWSTDTQFTLNFIFHSFFNDIVTNKNKRLFHIP